MFFLLILIIPSFASIFNDLLADNNVARLLLLDSRIHNLYRAQERSIAVDSANEERELLPPQIPMLTPGPYADSDIETGVQHNDDMMAKLATINEQQYPLFGLDDVLAASYRAPGISLVKLELRATMEEVEQNWLNDSPAFFDHTLIPQNDYLLIKIKEPSLRLKPPFRIDTPESTYHLDSWLLADDKILKRLDNTDKYWNIFAHDEQTETLEIQGVITMEELLNPDKNYLNLCKVLLYQRQSAEVKVRQDDCCALKIVIPACCLVLASILVILHKLLVEFR